MDKADLRIEVTMEKSVMEKHVPYFYAYVLGALWDLGELFTAGRVSVQIIDTKRVTKDAFSYVEKNVEGWIEILGLELRDEHTREPLTGGGTETTTQASDVLDLWGP